MTRGHEKGLGEARRTGEYYAWLNGVVVNPFQLTGAVWGAD